MRLPGARAVLGVIRAVVGVWLLWIVVVAPLMLVVVLVGASIGYGAGGAGPRVPVEYDAPLPRGPVSPPVDAVVLEPGSGVGRAEVPLAMLPFPSALAAGMLWFLATAAIGPALYQALRIASSLRRGHVTQDVVARARTLAPLIAGGAGLMAVLHTAASIVGASALPADDVRAVLWLAPLGWGLAVAGLVVILAEAVRVGQGLQEENDLTV